MAKYKIRLSKGERTFETVNLLIMSVICFVTLYPIWYTLILSFNDGGDALKGGIFWLPRLFTLDNYKAVFFRNSGIVTAYSVTVMRTLVGTVTNVFFTAMVAYAFSKKSMIGRKYYMAIGTITMFFNGGLIPFFLLLKNLSLLDTFWVYIIPTMFNFFNLLIFMAFFLVRYLHHLKNRQKWMGLMTLLYSLESSCHCQNLFLQPLHYSQAYGIGTITSLVLYI